MQDRPSAYYARNKMGPISSAMLFGGSLARCLAGVCPTGANSAEWRIGACSVAHRLQKGPTNQSSDGWNRRDFRGGSRHAARPRPVATAKHSRSPIMLGNIEIPSNQSDQLWVNDMTYVWTLDGSF